VLVPALVGTAVFVGGSGELVGISVGTRATAEGIKVGVDSKEAVT
jgi:hypothetical protein